MFVLTADVRSCSSTACDSETFKSHSESQLTQSEASCCPLRAAFMLS